MSDVPADWTPSEEQNELINDAGSRFVEACPGSGKTKAIVARYERLARTHSRRGVALVSFTNAAVDEVTSRSSDPKFLAPPNFVGTFDSFINRFISGPYVTMRTGRYPRFIDTWEALRGGGVRVPGMPHGLEFSLDNFEWDENGKLALNRRLVGGRFRDPLLSSYDAQPTAIDGVAQELWRHLVKDRQIVACSASRQIARSLLGNPTTRLTWSELIAARFAEVIVDEAQDSGAEEISVLEAALEHGTNLVLVADLDQSIFEFRRADPAQIRQFANGLPPGSPLTGNYRSTPAICRAADSLRSGTIADVAVGDNRDDPAPVRLIQYQQLSEVTAAVLELLVEIGLELADCKVLAHRRRDAMAGAGAAPISGSSGRMVLRIARASLLLASDADTIRRQAAIQDVERTLVEIASPSETRLTTTGQLIDILGLEERWLRAAAIRVAVGPSPPIGRTAYTAELKRIVSQLPWPTTVILQNLGNKLAAPPEASWAELSFDPPQGLPWGTVHSAKGREYEAVVLVIPKDLIPDEEGRTCLDLWEAGIDGESRRVLYVGATRAKRLLIVAAHEAHTSRVAALLKECYG